MEARAVNEAMLPNLEPVSVRLAWRRLKRILEGDALAAFPSEAFKAEAVVTRILGRRQFILNRPDAIRRVLVENPGNYVRSAATLRVLRPIFGRGLFLAEGAEWEEQRHTMASAFTPRAVRILARQVVLGVGGFIADVAARAAEPIDLVAPLRRLALDIIANPMLNGETIRLDGALRMQPK
jgi:unspecific monooxygenase